MSNNKKLSTILFLRNREYKSKVVFNSIGLNNVKFIKDRIDKTLNKICSFVELTKSAVKSGKWPEITEAVTALVNKLFNLASTEEIFKISKVQRQERDFFIFLGGIEALIKIFSKPYFGMNDARCVSSRFIERKSEFFNEILVILREIVFTIPSYADVIFTDDILVFIFTLLSHSCVFDNAINLLEEVLASRSSGFPLNLIPNVYSLISNFNPRQLAQFCRALSLILFEAEDRQLAEGIYSLRSLELLQLRRDRMSRIANVVELNQFLINEMPEFLNKLIHIINIMNHGPNVCDIIRYGLMSPSPFASEVLHMLTSTNIQSREDISPNRYNSVEEESKVTLEWKHLAQIDNMLSEYDDNNKRNNSKSKLQNIKETNNNSITDDEALKLLLEAFSSQSQSGSVGDLMRIMQLAKQFGLGNMSVNSTNHPQSPSADLLHQLLSQRMININASSSNFAYFDDDNREVQLDVDVLNALLRWDNDLNSDATSVSDSLSHDRNSQTSQTNRSNMYDLHRNPRQLSAPNTLQSSNSFAIKPNANWKSRTRAKRLLQFYSMILLPHQVEILFVLSCLLAGRNKIYVQKKLGRLGLDKSLFKMFPRMSWNSQACSKLSSHSGANLLEQVHGPDCKYSYLNSCNIFQCLFLLGQCNPENAVRIQFLRLIHGFYDRDLMYNQNKYLVSKPVSTSKSKSNNQMGIVTSISIENLDKIGDLIVENPRDCTYPFTLKSVIPSDYSMESSHIVKFDSIRNSLFHLILTTYIAEPIDSGYRFWLSSCIEAFLRGSSNGLSPYFHSYSDRKVCDMNPFSDVSITTNRDIISPTTLLDTNRIEAIEKSKVSSQVIENELFRQQKSDSDAFLSSKDIITTTSEGELTTIKTSYSNLTSKIHKTSGDRVDSSKLTAIDIGSSSSADEHKINSTKAYDNFIADDNNNSLGGDQMMVAQSGIINHLISNIIHIDRVLAASKSNSKTSENDNSFNVNDTYDNIYSQLNRESDDKSDDNSAIPFNLQTAYDLLSEIIKVNSLTMHTLNAELLGEGVSIDSNITLTSTSLKLFNR